MLGVSLCDEVSDSDEERVLERCSVVEGVAEKVGDSVWLMR